MSSTDKLAEQHAQLASLKASETDLVDGPDAALQVLGPPTDSIRLRAALGILARAGRYPEAADLIRECSPDKRWVDVGAAVFAYLGIIDHAQRLVDWADEYSDRVMGLRTRLGFAEGVFERWQKQCKDESLLARKAWPASDIEAARKVVDVLDPMLAMVRANARIQGEIELLAVQYGIQCAHIANDLKLFQQCANWLKRHVPIPLIVAELCLRRLTDCATNLPTRLRVEHAGTFQPAFLGALIDRELLNHPNDAFAAFARLATVATNSEERESVSAALFETCGRCSPSKIDEAIEIVKSLQPGNARRVVLLEVFKKLDSGDIVGARSQLDGIREETDAIWWQADAQIREGEGDEEGARFAWEQASRCLPHPEVIRRSVQASLDQRRFESAIRGLKKLLLDNPAREQDLYALAWALFHTGDLKQAEIYLERLVEIAPANAEYRMCLAQCLWRTAQTKKAITVLTPLCSAGGPPFEAILLQSVLLRTDGQSKEAFELLRPVAEDHWDEPDFLLQYVQFAHAAEQERLAHQAFVRLLELRRAGKVPDTLMQEKTLEELLAYGKEYREVREELQKAVVAGRVPWLWAEEQMRNPPTWAWALHTQDLKWNSEEQLNRAAFSVYATNGFTVRETKEGRRLESIVAPARDSEVVVDLSALLTLNELQRLEKAADFFGTLLLPSSYGRLRARDGDRLDHQPARETALLRIRAQVESKVICLLTDDLRGLVTVDEYSDGRDSHAYRLRDLIPPLQSAQKAPTELVSELLQVAHKASSSDTAHPPLDIGARLLVDLETLRTLAGQRIFDVILNAFSVCLKSSHWDDVIAELNAHEIARDARKKHFALWDLVVRLMESGKVRLQHIPTGEEVKATSDDEDLEILPLASAELARTTGKPLLADDRVLQVSMYQQDPSSVTRAFDTSTTLRALLEAGMLTARQAAEDIRRLMKWRYRFLVPPPDILFEWAISSIDNLPGDALLDVAAYLHDCLRDPGLHCGPEPTEPPFPIGAKLVTTWSYSIASFVAMVWRDGRFTDRAASVLTEWIGDELIPSCPSGLAFQPVGYNIVRAERGSMMGMFMVQFTSVLDRRRANLGLRILAGALGMNEDTFLAATAEAIRAIQSA